VPFNFQGVDPRGLYLGPRDGPNLCFIIFESFKSFNVFQVGYCFFLFRNLLQVLSCHFITPLIRSSQLVGPWMGSICQSS